MPMIHSRNRKGGSRIAAKTKGFGQVEGASTFITLAVCTMLSIGIYLASYAFNGKIGGSYNLSSSGPAFQNPARVKSTPQFQLAGVKMGMTRLETRNNYKGNLPESDPIIRTNARFEKVFGNEQIMVVAVQSNALFSRILIEQVY